MCRRVCFLRLVSESPPCGARKTSALGGVRVRFSTVAETSYGFCDLRVIASGAGRDFMLRRWKKEQANLLRYIRLFAILVFKLANGVFDRNIDPPITELFDVFGYLMIKRFRDTSGDTRLRICVAAERNCVSDRAFIIV